MSPAKTSHPARGAWIEMSRAASVRSASLRSHPARGAWIEIEISLPEALGRLSHPARGAWIEML